MSNGNWSDLPGGATARPYVKSLTVVNGSQSTPVFSGGVGAAAGVQNGDVTAVVMPFNLCRTGQAPAPGQCYATPNRVGVTLGYKTAMGLGRDFSRPSVALRQAVTESTVFDIVIGLNTLGRTLRWTWANGELVDWKSTGLGTDAAEIRLRIKPSVTPDIDWGRHPSGGCTATPIRDCDLARADGRLLGSELVLSLDETLSPALTGAVFATEGAIAGFLEPGGSAGRSDARPADGLRAPRRRRLPATRHAARVPSRAGPARPVRRAACRRHHVLHRDAPRRRRHAGFRRASRRARRATRAATACWSRSTT